MDALRFRLPTVVGSASRRPTTMRPGKLLAHRDSVWSRLRAVTSQYGRATTTFD